jgi:PAS domain S-box-containing protein
LPFFPDEEKKRIAEIEKVVHEEGKSVSGVESVFISKSGKKVNISYSEAMLRDSEGKDIGSVAVVRDVTEKRKQEAKLKKSNELNRLLIENLPVAIWMCDKSGRCNFINKEFTRLLGYRKEDVLGKTDQESPYVCETGLPYIKEGTIEALDKIWESAGGRKKPKKFPEGEIPIKAKDGKIAIHHGIEIPLGEGDTRLWASMDITELRKRELSLKSAISNLGSVLLKASEGDLSTKVNLSKISEEYRPIGDNINTLIASFNQMAETIKNASQEVSDKVKRMTTTSEEAMIAIEEISESMKTVTEEAVKQSTTAMNQAAAAEETQSALEEESKASQELSTIGLELLKLSDDLLDILKTLKIKPTKQKTKRR